ncbi:hypothetical protein [Isoptericola jiangsuensis]|uniref:hypothetical protein n=1 Tax=Isoptericola jiangsuensis TaxID=548579 RepID=UPI00114579D8|nr:hypothetical protein [Isoptericola jiangsuensis]
MRSTETPIFDALAREFESHRPLLHVARALGGDPLGDPLSHTHAFDVSYAAQGSGALPRRARQDAGRA